MLHPLNRALAAETRGRKITDISAGECFGIHDQMFSNSFGLDDGGALTLALSLGE